MSAPTLDLSRILGSADPRIGRSWWTLVAACAALGAVAALRLLGPGVTLADWLLAVLVLVLAISVIRHHAAITILEGSRRGEAESFARILSGLSRSVSPDSVLGAIVDELGRSSGADHVVVVRRRPDIRILEATLVSARPGIPASTTALPMSDLDDPVDDGVGIAALDPVREPREPVAIAVVPERVLVGAAPGRDAAAGLLEGWVDRLGVQPEPPHEPPAAVRGSHRAPMLVADRIARRVRQVYGLRHTLAAPLAIDGEVHGAIVLSRRVDGPWPASTRRLLAGASREASMALSRAYSHRAAEARASTDALTGLPNRRYFDEFCGLLARRRRADDAMGVLLIDIDRFKVVNDTYGHAIGDVALRAVAQAIVGAVREDDVPARFGGEEFVVLLRDPTADVARAVAERVRVAVTELDLVAHGIPGITVSVGTAVARTPDEAIEEILARADRAMYRAKRGGRNRIAEG